MPTIFDTTSSHKHTFTSGAVTTIAAGTATAGHILALRNPSSTRVTRLRSLEVEFILTTAFGAAQEVGFDAYIARSYSVAHTNQTALTITGGRKRVGFEAAALTGRIADTGALTAGTHTLDTNAFARGSVWCGAIGARLGPNYYDLSAEPGGIYLAASEGLVIRNTVLMGATGVGKWHFTIEWDEGVLS